MTYQQDAQTQHNWAAQGAPAPSGGSSGGHGRSNPAPDSSPSPVTTGDYFQAAVMPRR